jgi:hypothetical protein
MIRAWLRGLGIEEAIGITMSRGSLARLEVFAEAIAAGNTPVEAAKIAKYPQGTSFNANARKRAGRKDVKALVKKMQAPGKAKVQEQIDLSVDAQLRSLAKIAFGWLHPDDIKPSDSIGAHRLIAQINGHLAPEKRDITFEATIVRVPKLAATAEEWIDQYAPDSAKT